MNRRIITPAEAIQIREAKAAGQATGHIARDHRLHPVTVRLVVTGVKLPDAGGPIAKPRPVVARNTPLDRMRELAHERLRCHMEERDGHWLWTAATDNGYGIMTFAGSRWQAHRLAYFACVGPLPDDLVIDHECHNEDNTCAGGDQCLHRRCFNPTHLVPRTRHENSQRGRAGAHLARKTHCPAGHPYAGANLYVYVNKRGSIARHCRACRDAKSRLRRRPPD